MRPSTITAHRPSTLKHPRVEAISQLAVNGELHRLNAMLTKPNRARNQVHIGPQIAVAPDENQAGAAPVRSAPGFMPGRHHHHGLNITVVTDLASRGRRCPLDTLAFAPLGRFYFGTTS
jgi:hypothetical protein